MKKITIIFTIILLLIISSISSNAGTKDTMQVKGKEVVVTAMKYPELLIEIPMSISILGKGSFLFDKSYGFGDALKDVPGVLCQSRFGNQDIRITIRGYGARGAGDRSNAGTSRGIKILIDGIPETEPDGRTSFDNIDLSLAERVEVIRSNSSALWGNAAGGIINVSMIPEFDKDYMSRVQVLGGSYGFQKYIAQAASKIGQGKVFASFSATKADGYRANSNSERYYLMLGLKSQVSKQSNLGLFLSATDNKFFVPGPLTQDEFDTDPTMANSTYLKRQEFRYNKVLKFGVTFDHNFDEFNSIYAMSYLNPKYLQRSERGTYRDFTRYHVGGSLSYKNFMKIGNDLNNTILAGVDACYQDGAIIFYNLTSNGKRGDTISQNKSEGAANYGAFLQDEFRISDKISLIAGARYDNVTYYSQDFTKLNAKENRAFDHVTPKFAASYLFTPNHSVFFNIGGGVEVPAGNETDPAKTDTVNMINPLLDPIVSTTFEAGTKHLIEFENSFFKVFKYDLAVFYITTKNELVPYNDLKKNQRGIFYMSAGKTERIGVELAASVDLDYGLTLKGAFSFCASKYNDYSIDSAYYKKVGGSDYSGNKIAGTPEMYYSTTLKIAPPKLWGLFAEFNVQGVSKYYVDDANSIEAPSYNIMNLTIGLNEPFTIADGLSMSAFCGINNLTDEKYAASTFINPDSNSSGKAIYLEPGLPRNFVVGLSMFWK